MASVTKFTTEAHHPLVFLNLGFPLTVTIDGQEWPTVEHYFLAMKFPEEEQHEKIRQATLEEARLMAFHSSPCGVNDAEIDKTLMKSLRAKFQQYPNLAKKLASIRDHVIELKDRDPFLGNGEGTGKCGQNKLGILLAAIRAEIRNHPDRYFTDESQSDSGSDTECTEEPQPPSLFPQMPLLPLHTSSLPEESGPFLQFKEGRMPMLPTPRDLGLDFPPMPDYQIRVQPPGEHPERLLELSLPSRPKQTTVL